MHNLGRRRAWIALPFAALLSACGSAPHRVERPPLPPSLLAPCSRPALPAELRVDAVLALLLVDVWEALDDCAARLDGVRRLLDLTTAPPSP